MPYIRIRTNQPLNEKQIADLQKEFGKTIALFPGKTERWLMTDCEGGCHLSLAGKSDAPLAMVEVELLGRADRSAYDAVSANISELLERSLGIPGTGVYIKYEEIDHWGWNGSNF